MHAPTPCLSYGRRTAQRLNLSRAGHNSLSLPKNLLQNSLAVSREITRFVPENVPESVPVKSLNGAFSLASTIPPF